MDFEVHCMFILPTELSLFNYDKVKTGLQSLTPLNNMVKQEGIRSHTSTRLLN